MKKVLAISSVLLGVVFLAGCGQQPVSQTQPTTPAPVAQTPTQPVATQPAPTTVPADETATWKVYANSKYGFEMKIPQDWKTKDEEKINSSESKETINQTMISFSVQNKGEVFDTLNIMITPTKNINKCSNTALCNSGSDTKESNGFTFGFLSGAAGGGATPEYYAKYMEEKLKDNDTVMKSFKLTK